MIVSSDILHNQKKRPVSQSVHYFVRTRPRKISISETYTYVAEVGETIDFHFKKTGGEFKIDFLYDGVLHRGPWKLRKFSEGNS